MLGEYKVLHESYGHPALDACKTFTYKRVAVKNLCVIYGYANESNTVSLWMDEDIGLHVSFGGSSKCLGKVYASLTEKEKESLLLEIDTLGEYFPFFIK